MFPLKAGVDGVLRVDCTRILEQGEYLPSQADVGVKPESTTTAQQVATRQVFAKLLIRRQQRGTTSFE